MNNIFFYVLIRSRKSYAYFDRCIDSLLSQKYKNFKAIFVDDASSYSTRQKSHIKEKLKNHIVIFNKTRKYSVRNAYDLIHKYAVKEGSVIFNLDGDDWLLPNALSTVAKTYTDSPKTQLTFGDCLVWTGEKIIERSFLNRKLNTRYSKEIEKNVSYRNEDFLPLHPRTWKTSLFLSIAKKEFLDANGNWVRFPEDLAILFPMFDKINGNYEVIKDKIYVYNQANTHAVVKESTIPLLRDEIIVRKKNSKVKNYLPQSDKIVIKYNKLLSIPLLGTFLYQIQLALLKSKLISFIYVSRKPNNALKNTFAVINSFETAIIKSLNIYPILKNIKVYKLLDFTDLDINNMTTPQLYDLMWTLVLCNSITHKTKHVVAKILPPDYPVIK